MIKVGVFGAKGKMGTTTVSAVTNADDMDLVFSCDTGDDLSAVLEQYQPDVVIDFTHPTAVKGNITLCLKHNASVVVGTTGGLTENDRANFNDVASQKGLGIAICPNFALGVIMMMKASQLIAKHLPNVEITELHHNQKADAPSGTAIKTAELIQEANPDVNHTSLDETEVIPGARGGKQGQIPIHSVRLPGYIASQEVMFGGLGERVSVRHDTLSREAFMPGVLLATRKITTHKGLIYGLEHLLD